MDNSYKIKLDEWHRLLKDLSKLSYDVFVPVRKNGGIDYSLINEEIDEEIVYNVAKPFSPLKFFFLPFKLIVTGSNESKKNTIITGVPSCDIEALKLLDQIYLDKKYCDGTYLSRRENTLLIASDCYITQEYCHCTAYGIEPYPEKGCDISLSSDREDLYLKAWSEKGELFLMEYLPANIIDGSIREFPGRINELRRSAVKKLGESNIPGYEVTGSKIELSGKQLWKKYSSGCVSCGACAAVCPTCTCFLLIDKPGFEKVKQLDTCQYPAFERVAGGEDPLKELSNRFRHRYMCKYVWKPQRFKAIACTGCGRCIEACISKINKNELLMELI